MLLRAWFWRQVLIFAVVLTPVVAVLAVGNEMVAALVIAVMVGLGAVVRPSCLWALWVAAILPVALYAVAWLALGDDMPGASDGGETPLSLIVEWSLVFAPLTLVLPMALGRTLRDRMEARRDVR